MPKLTEREREGFEKILLKDLDAINDRFMNQIKDFWGIARKEILQRKGWDKLMEEKDNLETQKKQIINRIHEIESTLTEEPLRVEQVIELGGKSNEYGKCKGAQFYGIPVESQFEYEIVEYIRANIDLEIYVKLIEEVIDVR